MATLVLDYVLHEDDPLYGLSRVAWLSASLKQRLCASGDVSQGEGESPSTLMPRVHRIASLLKGWIMGTYQGADSHEYLTYYLDEFTFRLNRRRSRNRGKLFYRLVQQAGWLNRRLTNSWSGAPRPPKETTTCKSHSE